MNRLLEILDVIESDDEILKFRYDFDNLLIWPSIRNSLITQNLYDFQGDVHARNQISKTEYFKYLFRVLKYNPLKIKNNYDLVFLNSLIRKEIKKENEYFNIETDYFVLEHEKQSISLDISNGYKTYYPRYIKNHALLDYIRFKPKFLSMISNEKKEYSILDFLKEKNLKINKIKKILNNTEIKLKYHKKYFEKMMKKIQPKIIFFRTGYYGGFNAYYIKWAKKMGIKTAEFQHGVVSKMHPAYNYGAGLINSEEYKKYIPDYFLTYGNYWNREIRIPGKAYTIGNPHFHESIKNYKNIKEETDTIMIVSQGIITKDFVNIAEFLANKFKNKKIIFKLHPGEVPFEERYKSLYNYSNVEVKKEGDIYELLAKYENIVASFSTVVFEALAFNKRIYILKNKYSDNYIPENLGIRFDNNEELADLIITRNYNENDNNIEYYFNSNWKKNYDNFLKEIL
jgi:hypothetical protein